MLPSWSKQEHEPLPAAPTLLPLTPKYNPDDHGIYLAAIETALTGPDSKSVKNLALSGGYGVGKSSILAEVARRHDGSVITISMSTLGFSDRPSETEGVAKTASTRTNRIQKEIVKQLLYSQDPVKTPGSRYKRVTRFHFWREVGFGALVALPLTLVFYLSGWSASLGALVRLSPSDVDWINIPLLFAALAFVVGVRKVMHNRIHIERISTGGATIALSAQSATFFDEYLDEIVYFFERTKIDLVIFEDIDRFDDPHIFEALRALNSLLNGAEQLRGRTIRFVYAIKDSIFDELGQRAAEEERDDDEQKDEDRKRAESHDDRADEAELELARANRTKFFDQVIPVVPFVTHLSARNLLKTALDGDATGNDDQLVGGIENSVSDELIDLVGRYLADMRLIKNIRNEFAIFRQRIIVEGSLALTDDGVLAMVLYKSMHLSDFERIKHRQSDLDKLYVDYRDIVNKNLDRLGAQVRADRIASAKVKAASSWSTALGDSLITLLDDHLASQGARLQSRGFAGEPMDDAALRSPAVWRRISAGESVVVTYLRQAPYNPVTLSSTFSKEQLARELRNSIDSDEWVRSERERLDKRIEHANASIAFLRTASMVQLLGRDEFTLTSDGIDSLSHILDHRLGSELARQLVRHKYIDQNFTLYASTFHGVRVSAEATNFIIKNVDTHTMDVAFRLTDDDVEAVLREKGRSVLEDDSAYNTSFLSYLLRKDDVGANVLVGRLSRGGEQDRAFLLAYLSGGEESRALVVKLAPLWPGILRFIAVEAGLEETQRSELADLALCFLSADVEYDVDTAIGEFILERYAAFKAFTSSDVSQETATLIAAYVGALEIELPSLAPLSDRVKKSLIEVGAYVVDRANLTTALGAESPDLALDAMKATNKHVFDRALTDLKGYLSALVDDDVSIDSEVAFAGLVGEILDVDSAQLAAVVRRASDGLMVDDLEDVPKEAWTVLADDYRFPATFSNVERYFEQNGLDGPLAQLLVDAKEIAVDPEDPEADKTKLALSIIGVKDLIPDAGVRSQLVVSLDLDETIDATLVPIERGELVGRLVGAGIIDDDAEAFSRLASDDWSGREYAISQSNEFIDFMSPDELPVSQIGLFIQSKIVGDDLKQAVLDRLSEFRVKITRVPFDQLIEYAINSGHGLSVDELRPIAGSIQISEALRLLKPHLASISEESLIAIIGSLKEDYSKLAGPTGKRPKLKPSEDLNALITRLDELGWVAGATAEGDHVRVRMRQPK